MGKNLTQALIRLAFMCLILSVLSAWASAKAADNDDGWGGYTAEKPLKLKLAHWNPQQMPPPINYDPFAWLIERWAETIEEDTGHRVKFTLYPSESLVKLPDVMDALRYQICDVSIVHPPVHPGEFPSALLLSLPGLFPNATISAMVTQALFEEGYTAEEWKDVHVLWHAANCPQDVSCRIKAIEKLEDWKDLKIACFGEPEASTIRALGATPVGIPLFEQYIALERGTVDGVWVEFNAQVAFKFYEVSKYFTAAHGGTRTLDYCMSKKTYNSLPPKIKQVVDKNSGMYWSVVSGKHFDKIVTTATNFLDNYVQKEGNPPIYFPSDEEIKRWREKWQPVYDQVISDLEKKGFPAKNTYKRIIELVERYKKYQLGGLEDYNVPNYVTKENQK